MTPAELRESAKSPLDEPAVGVVVPQLTIALGKPRTEIKKPDLRPKGSAPTAPSGGINDAAARCEAEIDQAARLACRARFSGSSPGR